MSSATSQKSQVTLRKRHEPEQSKVSTVSKGGDIEVVHSAKIITEKHVEKRATLVDNEQNLQQLPKIRSLESD